MALFLLNFQKKDTFMPSVTYHLNKLLAKLPEQIAEAFNAQALSNR